MRPRRTEPGPQTLTVAAALLIAILTEAQVLARMCLFSEVTGVVLDHG
ncbi:hypothetical protein [Nevskia sp.]|nr:hypothetical protein [Nevskia sp.]